MVGKIAPEGCAKTSIKGGNRFENDASQYAAYLETPEGWLSRGLTFANLQDLLPAPAEIKSLSARGPGSGKGASRSIEGGG